MDDGTKKTQFFRVFGNGGYSVARILLKRK